MNRRITVATFALAALALWSSPGARAQVGPVFKEKELNEAAIIDALVPEDPVKLRSIQVRPTPGSPPPPPPKPAAASLLITFETNSAELTASSRSALDVVARALNSDRLREFSFAIEGHADPRGGHDLNMRLSQARAETVVDYLVRQHGIGRERLNPVGKGDFELANTTVPAAPENRRVTIKTKIQ
jgi:outer membrane protein OmpA-like peptidoglycan-associated protein